MDEGVAQLAEVVRQHLAEWDDAPPHVELAIHGSGDPVTIARAIEDLCRRALGAGVAAGRFYQSSIGAVSGVVLDDGREVVVKGHQPDRSPDLLAEIARIQRHAPYATEVLAGPLPFGRGHALVETMAIAGATADAHDPAVRAALARGLAEIVRACRPLVAGSTLPAHILVAARGGALWPTPHSKLFDFAATAEGAGWIDDVARAAAARVAPAGDVVIGHGDWRAEHVRLLDGRIVVAFDWDSLCKDLEPALVGSNAHGFTADWSKAGIQAPTLAEARAFVAEYEAARGRPFDAAERRLAGAAFAYACAYTARCGWSRGADERERQGTFQHLVASEGLRLLELRL